MTTSENFQALYDIIVKLRSPEGCEWDREQTPSTLRGALVEETYECLEAIDENDPAHIAEELGDLFLLATMIGYMHEQDRKFTVADVLKGVSEKLIRRHPHVFGDAQVKDSEEILKNWAVIKIQEGRKPKDSLLDEVNSGLPPMDRAYALQKKAAKVGFDWSNEKEVIAKILEELDEVQDAINKEQLAESKKQSSDELEGELGDLLFAVINLCRFLKVEPSVALRRTNAKFVDRFKYVETKMKETGQTMTKENIGVMDGFWNEAKKAAD
ncbi:MAG: nucleoside triphosphate pyrophosphohydrolase [Treponema sp.]|nr:nucleoside triphosphate pyrophosphohydrolase [Treponema sp.]